MKNKTKGYILTLLAGMAMAWATGGNMVYGMTLIWTIFSWYYYRKALQDRDAQIRYKEKHNL